MKKIFTLCLFAFAMVLGTQTVSAQSKTETNKRAEATAKKLQQLLKFDNDVLSQVYEAYKEFVDKQNTIEKTNKAGSSEYNKNQALIQERLSKMMKTALNDKELYNRYLIATDQSGSKALNNTTQGRASNAPPKRK